MKWPSAKASSYDGVPDQLDRLQFLARVAKRGIKHRQLTDRRVFTKPFSVARARQLGTDIEFAERVDAFVARFSRPQDTPWVTRSS